MNERKRKEWWVDPNPWEEEIGDVHDAFATHPMQGPLQWQAKLVRAIELQPGEIVLSREEFRAAYDKYHTEYELPSLGELESELFGEVSNASSEVSDAT